MFCKEYQTKAFIDVYVAELNTALTENCAANKAYNFRFTKDNLNFGNKMCSLCGNKKPCNILITLKLDFSYLY